MTFPTTSVLDNFNRANEDPLSGGGNWAAIDAYEQPDFYAKLLSNAIAGRNAADDSSGYWTPATFGANAEAFVTVSTLPASGEMVALWVRLLNPASAGGDTSGGYQIRFKQNGDGAGHDQILFLRYDPVGGGNGTAGTILSTVTLGANFSAGQQFGVSIVGTVITANRDGTSIATYDTVGDATKYSAAGNIGFTIRNTTAILDSFGGGTVVAAPTSSSIVESDNTAAIRMYYDD